MMIISTIQRYFLFFTKLLWSHNNSQTCQYSSENTIFKKQQKIFNCLQKSKHMFHKPEDWLIKNAENSLVEYLKSLIESPYIYRVSKKILIF